MNFQNSLDFARQQDQQDILKEYRSRFYIPQKNGKDAIYFCGNSLGLQPKTVKTHIEQELKDWAELGVEGHVKAKNPWMYYHHLFNKSVAKLVGALPGETAVMNTLTTNLHLLMVSFYRPKGQKYKIMIEDAAFPSDRYAVQSQLKFHGYDPEEGLIALKPKAGEETISTEDILQSIQENKDELALVLLGGVNYYTGQLFDMKRITKAAHEAGAMAGWDLAHAAGNIPMQLHNWEVDFAGWCTYKYLNSGPGGPAGVFIHEKHGNNFDLPRFAGWWGHDEETRFLMPKEFQPEAGAAGWQLSNAQVLAMAAHKAALEHFSEIGMEILREKSKNLTGFLEFLIRDINKTAGEELYRIITPSNPEERGCQLSIVAKEGKKIFEKLTAAGVVADWREPDVIRVAPVPLYNTFEEVYQFAEILSA